MELYTSIPFVICAKALLVLPLTGWLIRAFRYKIFVKEFKFAMICSPPVGGSQYYYIRVLKIIFQRKQAY